MILDGFYYPVIHFGRVILYVWNRPPVDSLFLASTYLVKSTSPSVLRRLLTSPVSPLDATLLIILSSYHLFKTLSPSLSGEGVLTH